MTRNRLFSIGILLALLSVMLGLQASLVTANGGNGDHRDHRKILEFDTMVGVSAPFAGATNAIRGVNGAGAPWVIRSGEGELSTSGRLEIKVRGLVLASTGNNPSASFRAIVSCLGSDATVQNVVTDPFPATMGLASAGGGNAKIKVNVTLPQPCVAPIVFVTNAAGTSWFAVTGG
jgi:hypothetical protein